MQRELLPLLMPLQVLLRLAELPLALSRQGLRQGWLPNLATRIYHVLLKPQGHGLNHQQVALTLGLLRQRAWPQVLHPVHLLDLAQ